MKQIDKGILENSVIQFFSSSVLAKKLYFNILCKGHFFCDGNYHLSRDNYDSILLVLVRDGTFTFRDIKGELITVQKNTMVILDCYEPHEYYTEAYAEFLWMHIDGANCRDFCKEIINLNGNIVKGPAYIKAEKLFSEAYDSTDAHEGEISALIYRLLVDLSSNVTAESDSKGKLTVTKAREYIAEHLDEEITTGILADKLHISPTHLSRLFRQYTGFSPYDYVIAVRISKAKEYLLTTDKSITDIAYLTGFNSQANFIYCFKNHEGLSPGKFRKLKF